MFKMISIELIRYFTQKWEKQHIKNGLWFILRKWNISNNILPVISSATLSEVKNRYATAIYNLQNSKSLVKKKIMSQILITKEKRISFSTIVRYCCWKIRFWQTHLFSVTFAGTNSGNK